MTTAPRLSHDLRLALSVLYSLPSSRGTISSPLPTSSQAHDFLLQFQSRNIRRKLKSRNQKVQSGGNTNALQIMPLDPGDLGSSWLACLALLSSLKMNDTKEPQVNYAEALFAAQTMVHRLRRVTLIAVSYTHLTLPTKA